MVFSGSLDSHILWSLFGAFGVSVLVGLILIRVRPAIERFTRDRDDHGAVQASHVGDPLRLGGVAVIAGLLFGASLLAGRSSGAYTLLLLATLVPVFLAGLWEDLGHGVSAGGRFIASLIAASLAVTLLGLWVARGDLAVLDAVMGVIPLGVFFTILLAALFCHAVNLIDGMNGLAATVVVFSSIGIAVLAAHGDLGQITVLALLLATATLGFQLLNWPVARLFLGDAGAYGLGHILVWLGISVIALAPDVAVPAVILVLFYPFADTFHTVFRRARERKKITEPDRMHLHQKVRRGMEVVWIGRDRRHISNPLTTLVMVPVTAGPVFAGALLWNTPLGAWIALAGFSAAFAGSHLLITALAKRYRMPSAAATSWTGGFGQVIPLAAQDEVSQFSGPFFGESVAVEVLILRPAGAKSWQLTTRADNAEDKTWPDRFETDRSAWDFFMDQVARLGDHAVLGPARRGRDEDRIREHFVMTSG